MLSVWFGPIFCCLVNPFPHSDTFWWVWEESLLKTLWEKEKLLVQAISPFPTIFSTLSRTEIIIFRRDAKLAVRTLARSPYQS